MTTISAYDSSQPNVQKIAQSVFLTTTESINTFTFKNRKITVIGEIDYYLLNDEAIAREETDEDRLYTFLKDSSLDELLKAIEGNYLMLVAEGETVYVLTDRFGKKELFFSKEELIISDTLEVFENPNDFDAVGLAAFFQVYGNYPPKKHTLFKNIARLGVGEVLTISVNEIYVGVLKNNIPEAALFTEKNLEEYYVKLLNAVNLRSTSTGINWLYLSSGWDSTAILALLASIHDKSRIRGVIGKMVYSERSGVINQFEIDRAHAIAEYYGIQLDEVELDYTRDEIIPYFKNLLPLLKNTLTYSFNSLNFALLSDFIGRNAGPTDVVFSGEISDGVHNLGFSQYATILDHPDLNFREYADKMASYLFSPSFLKTVENGYYERDLVYNFFKTRMPSVKFDQAETTTIEKKMQLLESFFIAARRFPFYSIQNSAILTENSRELLKKEMRSVYFKKPATELNEKNFYGWMIHLYNSFHWQGSTVKVIGRTLERYGKKIQLPFWDSGVQEFLQKMPETWGRSLDLHHTKYPLKWMLKNKIDYPLHLQTGPHSYLYDVNPGFSHLAETIFGSKLKSYFQQELRERAYTGVLSEDFFDLKYLDSCVDDFLNDIEFSGQRLQDLASLILLTIIGINTTEEKLLMNIPNEFH